MELDFKKLFTEEEASCPVTYGGLAVVFEEIVKNWIDKDNEAYEAWLKSINSTTDALIGVINDLNYKRIRDVRFFFSLLSNLGYGTHEYLFECYNKWCEEFDKLNKPKKEE